MASDPTAPGFNPLPRWKRALDLSLAAAALPVFALVAAALWLLTRRSAPGPLLFRQERIGHLGRPFALLKFRTMHATASAAPHHAHVVSLICEGRPMEKLDDLRDERLIRGAWLLRSTGLDELPQILNVLRGEMSLVGPRPCLPIEYVHYTAAQRRRFAVFPGLTGLWQVSGKNRTTFAEMIELDLRYARQLSPARDLAIIARTVPTLFGQLVAGLRRRRARQPATAPAQAATGLPAAIPPRSFPSVPIS